MEKKIEMQYPWLNLATYEGSRPLREDSSTVKRPLLKTVLRLSTWKFGRKTFLNSPFGYIVTDPSGEGSSVETVTLLQKDNDARRIYFTA